MLLLQFDDFVLVLLNVVLRFEKLCFSLVEGLESGADSRPIVLQQFLGQRLQVFVVCCQ